MESTWEWGGGGGREERKGRTGSKVEEWAREELAKGNVFSERKGRIESQRVRRRWGGGFDSL